MSKRVKRTMKREKRNEKKDYMQTFMQNKLELLLAAKEKMRKPGAKGAPSASDLKQRLKPPSQ